ncbi:NAD dependent epimerase/dehydratase family protein [Cooperia oncophora]
MPYEYYSNNLVASLNLIKMCQKYNVKNFVFSSSATVYGIPRELPVTENSPTGQGITNPYGQTKYMMEQILIDVGKAHPDWNIILLRYFNPVGAHPSGRIGEDPRGVPNNLMPFVSQIGEPRTGDIASVYCDPSRALKMLDWKAEFGLEDMSRDLWRWQSNNPNGFAQA